MNIWLFYLLFSGFWVLVILLGYLFLSMGKKLTTPKDDVIEIGVWIKEGFGRGLPEDLNQEIFRKIMKYLFLLFMWGMIVYGFLRVIENFIVL